MKYMYITILSVVALTASADKCSKVQLKSTRSTQSVACKSGQLFWGTPKGTIKVRFQGIKEPLCLKQGENAGPDVMTLSMKAGKKFVDVAFDAEGKTCVKPKSKRIILYIKGPAKKQSSPSTIDFAVQSEISKLDSKPGTDNSQPKPGAGNPPQAINKKKTPKQNKTKKPDQNAKDYPTVEERLGIDLDNSIESLVVKVGKFFWGILSKIFH